MTPELMRERAAQYNTEADNLGQIISSMDRLLGMLMTEWEGDASAAYNEKFNQLKPAFTDAQQLITDIATALTQTANIVEETDSQIASQFRM